MISNDGAAATVISPVGAIGNNGVGNVEGTVVEDAGAGFCIIAREGGIGDGEGAGG